MDAYEAELLALFVLSPYVKVEMRDMYRQYLQRSGSYNTVSKDLTCTVLNQVQFIFFCNFSKIWAREGREAAIFAYPEHYMTDGDGDEANQVAQNHWETVMLPQLSSHWRLMFLMEVS